MRISWNWLKEIVDISLMPEELAEILTLAGFEVEDIEDRRQWANGVVVGKVLEVTPHPNADKLRVCRVDVGKHDHLQIVCGASNVCADIYVPVALVGTYLPIVDLKLRPAKLRGTASEGMICSLAELGLEKTSPGIHIFGEPELILGSDVRPLLQLDDVILDLSATANRADALSMVGIAREVAALTGGKLHLPAVPELTVPVGGVGVEINEACPAYLATLIAGVKIGPAPDWLRRRLTAAGVRSINNVVDVTNYVMLEWGQPLHAFDYDRLKGLSRDTDKLTMGVRFAKTGETLTTLDGQTRQLQSNTLLITANDHPVALAGVMGGQDTEVHNETTSLVLEAALFDPLTVRRSARSFALRTEASARYERSVNPAELEVAWARAVQLLQDLTGGTATAQTLADQRDSSNQKISLRLERLQQVLGPVVLSDEEIGEITQADVERTLTALGCQLQLTQAGEEAVWQVTVPPYRYRDIEREIDLIEEVARLYGYDRFLEELPEQSEAGYLSIDELLKRQIRSAFRATGLTEVFHYSYDVGRATKTTKIGQQVAISNPLFTEYSVLRSEILPSLIESFVYNWEQNNAYLNAYEIGKVFWREEEGLQEADNLAGIFGGVYYQSHWGTQVELMNWYVAKGLLESVWQRLGITVEYQPDQQNLLLHPGRTASLWIAGQRLGQFGELHPQIRAERDLPESVYGFELNLEVLMDALDEEDLLVPKFTAYSSYPACDRDLALFAPLKVTAAEITRLMRQTGGELLTKVQLFDEYRGQNVPEGQRSLAFRLVYRASDRTLTDTEIEPIHQQIRDALVEKFGVTLRS